MRGWWFWNGFQCVLQAIDTVLDSYGPSVNVPHSNCWCFYQLHSVFVFSFHCRKWNVENEEKDEHTTCLCYFYHLALGLQRLKPSVFKELLGEKLLQLSGAAIQKFHLCGVLLGFSFSETQYKPLTYYSPSNALILSVLFIWYLMINWSCYEIFWLLSFLEMPLHLIQDYIIECKNENSTGPINFCGEACI